MLSPKKILNQLIPILRPCLVCDPTELPTFKLMKAPTDCTKETQPFATIQLISDDTVGQLETGEVISDVGLQFKEHHELRLRINAFHADAYFRLNLLKSCLCNPDIQSQLTLNGFGFKDAGPVNDLTGLDDTSYEERARVDLMLYAASGDLDQYTATDPLDKGKAGVGNFFDIDPVEQVNVVEFALQDRELTTLITNQPPTK